jgi:hypothetical protein
MRSDDAYGFRPGDAGWPVARRCQTRLARIKAAVDHCAAIEAQGIEDSLHHCQILELKARIEYLRQDATRDK